MAADHAESGEENESTLRAYLKQVLPSLAKRDDFEAIAAGLWRFTGELADLIGGRRNSIWAFIIRNGYRPAMLRERFDYVVGNPPWLSYRYIADPEYQAEVKKRAVDDYAIAPKAQKLITQMELATVFLVHALKTFGRDGAKLGFVMPRSILTSDQHAKLRERTYKAPVTIEKYWDLWHVKPVFNVPSCVVFATRVYPEHRTSYELPAVEWEGKMPERDVSWAEARRLLRAHDKKARVIYLGSRSALSTRPGRTRPSRGSPYASGFRNGATIYPRNFYFVRVRDLSAQVDPERLYWAETDPVQAKLAKAPYHGVRMSGEVEGRCLFTTALSQNVLPFVLVDPPFVVLPALVSKGNVQLWTASELKAEGFRHAAKWFQTAEEVWVRKRGRKAERQDLYEWLDYQGKLIAQSLRDRHVVLYNASGTDLCATTVDRQATPAPFVVDHKTYWMSCSSREEADYLTAVLNSPGVNEAIKPFQSTGLMGERDIHKKVLDLPIPSFKPSDRKHQELAKLGASARKEVAAFLAKADLPASLARRRGMVRESLAVTFKEIDQAVYDVGATVVSIED